MEVGVYQQYFQAMEQLEAREYLMKLNLADYPNMKQENRGKLYKSMRKAAYPNEKSKIVSTKDLAAVLNG